ncbi:MAG TPA: hypothetical protein ACFYEF_12870 [Candidatus Wunengus sp. YC63]|uniref:hypothetical protein n=1 Tax=unclassified Candidatus Wunengus TaxID=3367695 RepID=UPI0040292A1F
MKHHKVEPKFAVYISNEEYEVSLELRKIYKVLPDAKAAEHHYIRVIDESGEDYLYPEDILFRLSCPKLYEKRCCWYLNRIYNITNETHKKNRKKFFSLFSYLSWAN